MLASALGSAWPKGGRLWSVDLGAQVVVCSSVAACAWLMLVGWSLEEPVLVGSEVPPQQAGFPFASASCVWLLPVALRLEKPVWAAFAVPPQRAGFPFASSSAAVVWRYVPADLSSTCAAQEGRRQAPATP